MPCFCTVPAAAMSNRFNPGITPIMPSAPLTLQLAAALPALAPATRLDMQIDSGFENMRLPNIDFGGAQTKFPLMQIAMTLSMMSGTFVFDDLPMLEFQMQQAAESFNHNLWPRLSWMPKLKLQPLLNFAIMARLVLDLQKLGIDPFTVQGIPPAPMIHSFRFKLTPPKLHMARIMAGLPPLMQLSPALAIPPLGETGAVSAMSNRLNGLAQLTPPKLIVPMPVIMKMVMVLESLATIEAAFGDAFSPMGMGRIRAMLRLWGAFPIPIPAALQALALKAKLDALPPLEDIRLGEQIAGSVSGANLNMAFSPPKLAIMPFMNVMMALSASMEMTLDMPPFDMCSMCNCA